jgi:hypothetical protein
MFACIKMIILPGADMQGPKASSHCFNIVVIHGEFCAIDVGIQGLLQIASARYKFNNHQK